jgi:succinate-acetate transporter protein
MAVHGTFDSGDLAAQETLVVEEEVVIAPAADPAVFGLLIFSVGGTVLGLSLLGYVSAAAQGGSVMPIILAATGLGVFIVTIWSAALGQTFVAAVFGAFTGYWWSYAALVLGLTHNWFGIPAADATHVIAQFLIAWSVVILALVVVSTSVPSAYTAILTSALVATVLLIPATLNGTTGLTRAAGVFTLIYSAVGFYAYLAQGWASVGGPTLPLGTPVAQMLGRRR